MKEVSASSAWRTIKHSTAMWRSRCPSATSFAAGGSSADFVAEAQKAAAFRKFPGIVTIHDVGHDGDLPYIVMEYIAGEPLGHWAARIRPDHQCVAILLVRIATAMGPAHQARLFHRDLKPANILIDERGEPQVADFGLALHEDLRRQKMGEISGTAHYMAPEQVRGETHLIDGRTDIWSLGVILYELLCETRPFNGKSRTEIFEAITTMSPRPPRQVQPGVPAELSRICLRCLEPRSSDRYPSTSDLIDDLQSWLESVAGSPGPVAASVVDAIFSAPVVTRPPSHTPAKKGQKKRPDTDKKGQTQTLETTKRPDTDLGDGG